MAMTIEQVRREIADMVDDYLAQKWIAAIDAHLTQPAQAVDAWMILTEEGDPSMLFFDRDEALHYCDEGEEPIPLTRALAGEKAGWRDIATAPKDGTCVLLAWNENGEWQVIPGALKTSRDPARSGWVAAAMDYEYLNGGAGLRFCDFAVAPTHWQPLPTPPTDGEE